MFSLICVKSNKAELEETESRWWLPGAEGWGKWGNIVKGTN